jgi:hypothetical protein
MALPIAAANAAPQNPAFVNMISLFLSSSNQVPAEPSMTPVTRATPAQLADSMIKSMLGGAAAGLASELTNPLPVAIPATAPQTTASPVQVADSMIQSMLGKLTSGNLTSGSISTPPAPVSTDARKQSRTPANLPMLTAMVALPPVLAAPTLSTTISTSIPASMSTTTSTTPLAAQSSPTAGAPSATVPGATQLPAPAPPTMPLARSEIAFTAILTPMKSCDTPPVSSLDSSRQVDISRQVDTSLQVDTSRQVDTSPQVVATSGTTSSPPIFISATATAPVVTASSSTELPAAQSPQSQAAVQHTGKDSNGTPADGNMQHGGDTPSQQQNDSPATSAKVIATADAKVKPANVKQDDNGVAVAGQGGTPVADASLTTFPEQARAAAAETPSETPAAATAPFHSTADALRTVETNLPEAPPLRAGAAQEISMRIAQPDSSTIDLRVVERSGQLHVDVRTTDTAMQTSLRQDLGTLTNSLNRAGYHSETFTPSSTSGRMALSAQMSNQDDRQDPSQNRGGSGNFSGGRRQQQQQKRPSIWLEELENQQ